MGKLSVINQGLATLGQLLQGLLFGFLDWLLETEDRLPTSLIYSRLVSWTSCYR